MTEKFDIYEINSDNNYENYGDWHFPERAKSIIYIFGRDSNKNKIIKKVTNFLPYFYIKSNSQIPASAMRYIKSVKPTDKVNFAGEKVDKVEAINSKVIPELRRELENCNVQHFSADVLYRLNFTLTHYKELEKQGIGLGIDNCRIFVLDIETTTNYDSIDASGVPENIISISLHDNYTNKYYTWIWRSDFEEMNEFDGDKVIHFFKSEITMLNSFLDFWSKESPDIISTWNGNNFDIPYLINKCNQLKINVRRMSPIGKVWCWPSNTDEGKEVYYNPQILGVVLLDGYSWYKEVHLDQLRSGALDAVAKDEGLGSKESVNPQYLWETDWRKLIEYNVHDCFLTKAIIEKRKIIDFVSGIRKTTWSNFEDLSYFSRSIDMLLLQEANKRGVVMPTKPSGIKYQSKEERKSAYVGAHLAADVGVYHGGVAVYDFSALYPSVYRVMNISYETLSLTKPEGRSLKFIIPKTADEDGEKITVWVSQEKRGMIPTILENLIKLREKYDEGLKNAKTVKEAEEFDNLVQATKNLILSVPKDSMVLVKDNEGNPLWEEISKINIKKTPLTLSVNKRGRSEWKRIQRIVKHTPLNNNLLNIQTQYGYKIRTTPNHSLFTFKNNKLETIEASKLNVGDKIVCSSPQRVFSRKELKIIRLTDYLDENDKRIEVLFKHNILKNCSYSLRSWCKRLNNKFFTYTDNTPFTRFLVEKKIVEKRGWEYKATPLCKKILPFLKLLSTKKQQSREGKWKYYFILTLKEFNSLNEEVKNFFDFTLHYNKCWHSKKISTNLIIRNSFLKLLGWYISEGSLDENTHQINLSQKLQAEFWEDMKEFETDYGIIGNKFKEDYSIVSPILSKVILKLCGRYSQNKQLPSFFFKLNHHQQDILIHSYLLGDGQYVHKKKDTLIPYWTAGTVSKKLMQQLLLYYPESIIIHDSFAVKNGNKLIYDIEMKKRSYVERINKHTFLLKIRKIEKIKTNEKYLYDLEVEDNQNFVCGDSGFILAHNTSYGATAMSAFRLHKKEVSSTVTFIGRTLIRELSRYAKERGMPILYNHTDSFFAHVNNEDIEICKRLEVDFNKHIKEFCQSEWGINPEVNLLNLKFEKLYRSVLVNAKSTYAGWLVWKKGKIRDEVQIAGMQSKKSDSSYQLQYLQSTVIEKILKQQPIEEIEKLIFEEIDKIKNCKDFEWVGIPTRLGKSKYDNDIPKQRANLNSKKLLNLNFLVGQKPLMVYIDMGDADCLLFEFNNQLEGKNIKIDVSKMAERNVLLPLENILSIYKGENYWNGLKERVKNTLSGQQTLWDSVGSLPTKNFISEVTQ